RMVLISSVIVLTSMFISLLLPGLAFVGALKDYYDLRALGESGMHHLLAAKNDLLGSSSLGSSASSTSVSCATSNSPASAASTSAAGTTSGNLTDPATLKAAQEELLAAQRDFRLLQNRLQHPDWVLATAASIPGVSSSLRSVQALAYVGYDASTIGVE